MNFIQSHRAFNDTLDSLKNEFAEDTSNDLIILGAHDFSKKESINKYKEKFNRVIVFNQEPLLAKQRQFMHPGYFTWLKLADEVWDYDEKNIDVLKTIRSDIKLHVLKPYKNWKKFQQVQKDIDILFYGMMNAHRQDMINLLSRKYKVKVIRTYDDTELDNYIMRSKILLNIHYYYECSMQEQARIIRWIGAPCRIISEKSWKNYLNVEEFEYNELEKL